MPNEYLGSSPDQFLKIIKLPLIAKRWTGDEVYWLILLSNNYLQVFLEEHTYIVKEKQVTRSIKDDLEISSNNSDGRASDEKANA